MANKNPTIDIAKGIAIILVVYGHVIEHSMAPFSKDFFQNPVFKVIYAFHMPLFVFISGYLMAYSLNRNSIKDVFKSRCRSLLVPFLVLSVLGTIIIHVLNTIFATNPGGTNILGDLANQVLLRPLVWFLITLFVLSVLLLCSVQLEKHIGVTGFAGIYFLLMMIPNNNYCDLYYIKWFYLFYLAGYFFNRYKIVISNPAVKRMILPLALLLFVWLLTYWNINDYIYVNKMNFASTHYIAELSRLIYRYVLGFLGITIAFYLAEYLTKTKTASFLGMIGLYSLDIYIIQLFLLEGIYPRIIYKENIHLDFNSPLVLYVAAPLITVFFLGICLVSSTLLIRKNRLLSQLLLGGRTSFRAVDSLRS